MISDIETAVLSYHELQNVTGVVIKICTPLRIRHGGRLVQKISFQTLIRNITNRIISITERYGGWTDRNEAEKVLALAAEVRTVREELRVERMERYSNRINGKMDFGGMTGEVEYEGGAVAVCPMAVCGTDSACRTKYDIRNGKDRGVLYIGRLQETCL